MAQRAVLESKTLCSLCGARVGASAAECVECSSPLDGSFSAIVCPFCGSVTPRGKTCAVCATELGDAGAPLAAPPAGEHPAPSAPSSPLPASWTAGDIERVPKKPKREERPAPAPTPVKESPRPPADAPASAVPEKPARKAPAPAPGPATPAPKERIAPRPSPPATAAPRPPAPPPRPEPSITLHEIEAAQLMDELATLLLKVNTAASKKELLDLRAASMSVVMALEEAGMRPRDDEHEPMVVKGRVVEVAKRLREADLKVKAQEAKIQGLERDIGMMKHEVEEARTAKEAMNLLDSEHYAEEGVMVVLRRVKKNMAAMRKLLERSDDESRQKAVKTLEKLEAQIDEVVGKEE